jgi:hypothetical protein
MTEPVYAIAYPIYDELGWPNSVKVHRRTKWPPPTGFTGHNGCSPSAEQKAQWAAEEPGGNIIERLPPTHVGIDVDHYGAKRGGLTLAEAELRWGVLPPTYTATSRDDGISGIRLYRIPEGVKLVSRIEFGELGLGDIEIIQHHHRYVMCWPSIHPEGKTYVWRDPAWSVMERPPSLEDIPELPEAWVEALKDQRGDPGWFAHPGNGYERVPADDQQRGGRAAAVRGRRQAPDGRAARAALLGTGESA